MVGIPTICQYMRRKSDRQADRQLALKVGYTYISTLEVCNCCVSQCGNGRCHSEYSHLALFVESRCRRLSLLEHHGMYPGNFDVIRSRR